MSKKAWGAAAVTSLGLLLSVALMPRWLHTYLTILFLIALIVCVVGFLLAKDSPKNGSTAKVSGYAPGSNVAAAGRDVHQTIYHAGQPQITSLIRFLITTDHTCYSPNTWPIGPVRFLHAKIQIDHGSVLCSAYLTRIAKDNEVKWEHGPEQLTFSNHTPGDPLPRTLHQGLSYNLDVLVIVCEGSEIRVCNDKREWQRWPRLREIFADKGDYVLTLKLAGDGAESKTIDIQFKWTGYWQTSFLTLPNEQSPPLIERGCLKVSFDGDSLDCMHPVEFRTADGKVVLDKGVMARLRLDSETESGILKCKASLTSIEKDGHAVMSGVHLPLFFNPAQAPCSDTKTVEYEQPEYLEVLWLSDSGKTEIKTHVPFAYSEEQYLNPLATYSLYITFSADNIKRKTVVLNAECRSGSWKLAIKQPL